MKIIFIVAMIALLFQPAKAQELQVTAKGTIDEGLDAGVGSTFTETYTIDDLTIGQPADLDPGGTGSSEKYYDPAGTGKMSFAGRTYTVTGITVYVATDQNSYPSPIYEYIFDADYINSAGPGVPSEVVFNTFFSSTNQAIAPTSALSSIQKFPIADFQVHDVQFDSSGYFMGTISSYSVTTIAVPEPSSLALILIGLGVLAGWRLSYAER